MWIPRRWRAMRVIGALFLLLGIAAGTAAYHIGPSFTGFLLGCVSFGLACLGLGGLSMDRNTVILHRSGPLPEAPPSPCTPPLSEECEKRVELLFEPAHRETVRTSLVRDCGNNLWPDANAADMDRLRFAVLKLSRGRLDRFNRAVEAERTDWRDVLWWAGFGNRPEKHKSWLPKRSW